MRQPFDLVRVPAVLSQYVRAYYRLLSINFRYVAMLSMSKYKSSLKFYAYYSIFALRVRSAFIE